MAIVLFLSCTFLFNQCYGGTWNDAKDQHVAFYDAYAIQKDAFVDIIPRSNDDSPIDVQLSFDLYAFAEYDAVSGALELMGSLSMNWTDEIQTLNKSLVFNAAAADDMIVDYLKLWTPVIVLINSADSVKRVGDETYKVRYNIHTGLVSWKPRMILRVACTPDVTYFPFDEQTCVLRFTPWFTDFSMVRLSVSSSTWNLDQYGGNGVWEVKTTSTSTFLSDDYYYADFTITFSRQPVYFTVNIVLPVLLLSLLSGFVFLLPAASGERIGFAITCFLSFVVLLQTMMKFLPEASAPMSLFCYYVIVMMLFSGLVTIVTTLLLRVHHKSGTGDDVWRWLVHAIEVITCVKCKRMKCSCKRNSVKDDQSSTSSSQIIDKGEMGSLDMPKNSTFKRKMTSTTTPVVILVEERKVGKGKVDNSKINHTTDMGDQESTTSDDTKDELIDISWEDVCRILDVFFFLAFLGVQAAFSVFFLVPLGSKA